VTAKPLGEKKGDKVRVLRFRPKTRYSSQIGHRQQYTLLEIVEVKMGSGAKRSGAKSTATSTAKSTPKSSSKSSAKSSAKSTAKSTAKSAAKDAADRG
jgi:hypothetical protein